MESSFADSSIRLDLLLAVLTSVRRAAWSILELGLCSEGEREELMNAVPNPRAATAIARLPRRYFGSLSHQYCFSSFLCTGQN